MSTLKIMPFGDSITYGVISAGQVIDQNSGGYRTYLWNDLQGADLTVDFVGALRSGPTTFDRDNEGLKGKTIDYLDSVDQGLLATYKPDVVLLMIGTNDTKTDNASQMINQLNNLIVSIATADPGATIFVAGIPPIYDSTRNVIAQQYNAMIPGLVDQLNDNYRVLFVDTSDLKLSDITPPPGDSGVHPTAAGYEKIAGDFFDALIASGIFSSPPPPPNTINGDNLSNTLTGTSLPETINGFGGSDTLYGKGGNDVLDGGSGNDSLFGGTGADLLKGGDGDDRLRGEAGRDEMWGGTGADAYVFDDGHFGGASAANSDVIHDFNRAQGDSIRLNLVDAKTGITGDQTFSFIGTSALSHVAGQLRYEQISGNTYVQGDTNGDAVADFWIRVDGLHNLTATDFLL